MKSREELQKILDGFTYPHPTSNDLTNLWLNDICTKEEVIEIAHMAGYTTNEDIEKWGINKVNRKDFAIQQKHAYIPAGIWRSADVSEMQGGVKAFANLICDFNNNESKTKGLLIIGKDGTSKTYTSCAVLNSVLKRTNKTARFIDFSSLFNALEDIKTSGEFINELGRIDVLVIDNLDVYDLTEYKLERLLSLIRSRGTTNKHTIITSSYSTTDLYSYFNLKANKETADAIMKVLNDYDLVTVDKYEGVA